MNAIIGNTQWNLQELWWRFGTLHNTPAPTPSEVRKGRVRLKAMPSSHTVILHGTSDAR